MPAAPSRSRTLAALLLLGAAFLLLFSLGRWQLDRAAERRAIFASIQAGRAQTPLVLSPATPASVMQPWRAARAEGRWRPDLAVLVENRNHVGRPGYWLAMPLQFDADATLTGGREPAAAGGNGVAAGAAALASAPHGSGTAVLVLRGWLPRVPGEAAPALPPMSAQRATVHGELVPRVPRIFELWRPGAAGDAPLTFQGGSANGPTTARVINLDLADYARATGLQLLPAVLQQTGAQADGLVRDWAQPSVDANKNVGYAMQWFAFAAIAGIAWVVVAARAWRRSRRAPRAASSDNDRAG